MADEDKDQEQGFTVKDRRRFDATGDTRDSGLQQDDEESAPRASEQEDPARRPLPEPGGFGKDSESGSQGGPGEPADSGQTQASELTFSGFVIGLAQQAFMFLGVITDPQTSVAHKDLAQAKAMIDIIEMLRDKTRGNLEELEERMMEEMLEELHLQYVRQTRAPVETQGDNQ